ncbi:MAG TPA: transglycosylase SLT domain-containing protein [Thermoanaerobaculia bacterium]|nr:transglycosylase SLT domain-containing protein [Thermoanaerobaculia bacterium]
MPLRRIALLTLLSLPFSLSLLCSAPRRTGADPVTPAQSPAAALDAAPYHEAAAALRAGDAEGAQRLLARAAAGRPDRMPEAMRLSALYAYAAGDDEQAAELLAAAPAGGPLEDWRLFLLGETAGERGDDETAAAAFERLLATVPGSPLRPQAYLAAAGLAADRRDDERVLGLVAAARAEGVGGAAAAELESLAWRIGHRRDDAAVRAGAARRLLVEAPFAAGKLRVAETFRAFDGGLDLGAVLSADEVKRRAYSFLDGGELPQAALSALDALPEASRDLEWHLLKARALTGSSRGGEALALLAPLAADERPLSARLELARSLAAAESAERGGGAARRVLLRTSHRHLLRAARLVQRSPELAELPAEELRSLYADFLDAGLFEPAVDALRILRLVDPRDTTGARPLWERGWRAYRAGDDDGAIGIWTALGELYPEHPDAQRGSYWKARAFEELGQPAQARDLYYEMVAASDTMDFYSRRALDRLGRDAWETSVRTVSAAAAGAWTIDPLLARAKLLTDLGLDALAEREMELVGDAAEPHDRLALEAILLGRQGEEARSLLMLRAAFPALGGPRQVGVPAEILRAYYPLEYGDEIRAAARANRLAPALVAGIIRQESAFDPRATSRVGARGLMQLMPATAREMSRKLGMDYDPARLYDPEVSLRLGAAYLRQLIDEFDGNVELAVASYNGGPNRIRRLWKENGGGELDAFVETMTLDESRDYVKRVLVLADSYRQLYPLAS